MGPTCAIKGSRRATPKTKQFFFAEQNFSAEIKPDHKLSELWMIFYFVWCFFAKRVISSHNNCALILIKICPKCFQLTHETMTCIEDNVKHHLPCLALGKLSDKKIKFFMELSNQKMQFVVASIMRNFKGCVCYIFALFCMSKREHLWNKK